MTVIALPVLGRQSAQAWHRAAAFHAGERVRSEPTNERPGSVLEPIFDFDSHQIRVEVAGSREFLAGELPQQGVACEKVKYPTLQLTKH